ncbi:MAG: DUF4270 family protein [Bacteroidales bacterium]
MKHFRIFFAVIFTTILAFNFISCEEEASEIGINLQPGADKIILASDTLQVETHTIRDSNIASNGRSISPLGCINEADFGLTEASFITQVRLSSSNVDEDQDIAPDYLEFVLDHSGFYGDTNDSISIQVFRVLNTDFDYEENYYSDYETELDTTASNMYLLGNYNIAANPSDSLSTLKIDDQSFLDVFSNPEIFKNNDSLLSYVKGFYFKPVTQSSQGGGIAYINLLSDNSRLVMHYNDTSTYNFNINTSCVRINMFNHDYNTASPDLISALNDTVNEEISFLHSAAGLKTIIRIKDNDKLDSLANKGINRAQLQVKIHPDFQNTYGVPDQLTIIYEENDGNYDYLTDYKTNSEHFGGSVSEDKSEYIFNIPLHIQELVKNDGTIEVDNNLFLFPLKNRTTAGHCAIYGGNHPEYPMQIKIITSDY